MVTQLEIARRLRLDVSSVNKILRRRPGSVFKKSTIARVFRMARKLGYEFSRLDVRRHRRYLERRAFRLPVRVTLHAGSDGVVGEGSGVVQDITRCGTRIGQLRLSGGHLPARPFALRIRFVRGALVGVELRARVVRLFFDRGSLAMGVVFVKLTTSMRQKLQKALD